MTNLEKWSYNATNETRAFYVPVIFFINNEIYSNSILFNKFIINPTTIWFSGILMIVIYMFLLK